MLTTKISGGYHIATVHNGQYVKMRYFGYTKREAIRLFKLKLKTN